MCSGAKMYNQSIGWSSYLLLALSVATIFLVLANYKGRRTLMAAFLVAIGSVLMFTGQFYTFEIIHYNIGTFFIFFGVWINASFRFFYRKYIRSYFINIAKK